MYYFLRFPRPSIVVIVCHSYLVDQFSRPLPSVCQLFWVKVTGIVLCGAVRPTAAQCGHTLPICPPAAGVPLLEACVPLFFISFICSYRRLIYFFCLATVSIEIARLAANSASGPHFVTLCVATAKILLR